jgi:transcriptional regulator with XRE-family HTH domain
VAEKIGTTQSAVARMESGGGKHSPSLATRTPYADALGCKLEGRLIRRPRPVGNLTGHHIGLPSAPAEQRPSAALRRGRARPLACPCQRTVDITALACCRRPKSEPLIEAVPTQN